jgi:hypothetical protein
VRAASEQQEREFDRVRAMLAAAHRELSAQEVEQIAQHYLAWRLHEDENIRTHGLSEEQFDEAQEQLQADLETARAALARGSVEFIVPMLEDFSVAQGIEIAKDSPSYPKLAYALLKADVRAMETMQRRDTGGADRHSTTRARKDPAGSTQAGQSLPRCPSRWRAARLLA